MSTVLAGADFDRTNVIELVELVVAIGIANPPHASAGPAFVDHYVQAVERVEQPVRTNGDVREIVTFLLGVRLRFGRRWRVLDDLGEIDVELLDLGAGRGADWR